MPAGTISLTNNSTAVAGAGTDFESELNANDFIVITVGGETYTLGVAAVVSGTALTLIRPFSGPTTSGIAWGVVPANTMVRIAAELAEQTTFALRTNNIAKINWNAVFSESGDITVTLLDGTTFSGPSWKKIVDLLAEIDIDAVQQLASQVSADAQQVATDKQAASDSASAAEVSRQAALTSSTNANNKASAAASSATAAASSNTSAQQAKTDAETAKTAAEAAAASVPSMANIDAHLQQVGVSAPVVATNLDVVTSTAATVVNFTYAAGATNAPDASAGDGRQVTNGTLITQYVTSAAGNNYRRSKTGSAAFTAWVKTGFNDNDLTGTAWITATLLNGWTILSGRRAVYRKVLGLLFIEISANAGTIGAVIFTLPPGFRPAYEISVPVVGFSSNANLTCRVLIRANGEVVCYDTGNAAVIEASFQLPLQ